VHSAHHPFLAMKTCSFALLLSEAAFLRQPAPPCVRTATGAAQGPARRAISSACDQLFRRLPSLLLLCLTGLWPLPSRAQVTPHPTTTDYLGEAVPQLVAKSTAVFEGKVVGGHSFWNSAHNMIYTTHTVEIYKVFKGQAGPTVEIVTEGGIT